MYVQLIGFAFASVCQSPDMQHRKSVPPTICRASSAESHAPRPGGPPASYPPRSSYERIGSAVRSKRLLPLDASGAAPARPHPAPVAGPGHLVWHTQGEAEAHDLRLLISAKGACSSTGCQAVARRMAGRRDSMNSARQSG